MFQLDRITAGYDGNPVLRDVTLKVPPGRVVALLGPNGAGKTTLLRVASGLLRPMSGEITHKGQRLTDRRPETFSRAGICHIPEGRGIFRSLSVRDNLLLHAAAGDTSRAVATGTSAFPRLGERLNQRAGTLSGGEQQMLATARAYMARPDVVMLDEVSLGLAPKVIDEIFAFLSRLKDMGISLLLVEQYVSRALEIADFVFLLNQGRVVFAGETAEVDAAEIFNTYVGAHIP